MMKAICTLLLVVLFASAAFAQPQAPNIEWSHTYGGDSSDSFISGILPTSDGGYMLGGSVFPYGSDVLSDMLLMKVNAVGDSVWNRAYNAGYETCSGMLPAADGGFLLAGDQASGSTAGFDFMLLKTNAQGDCLWSHTYGRQMDGACKAVQPTSDGGYLLAG
jgi:hypothetical protein